MAPQATLLVLATTTTAVFGAGIAVEFAPSLTDHAVLQRGDLGAAVYGVVHLTHHASGGVGESASAGLVQIDVTVNNDGTGKSYTIAGANTVVQAVNASYSRWKARLHPGAASDGSHTITVTASSSTPPPPATTTLLASKPSSSTSSSTATIRDVVFGECWFCSGQSNAWLPMHFSLSRNRTYDAVLLEGTFGRYFCLFLKAKMQRECLTGYSAALLARGDGSWSTPSVSSRGRQQVALLVLTCAAIPVVPLAC